MPGIGLRRRKTLLTTFGSLSGVRRATREELAAIVGAKAAEAVIAYFSANPKKPDRASALRARDGLETP